MRLEGLSYDANCLGAAKNSLLCYWPWAFLALIPLLLAAVALWMKNDHILGSYVVLGLIVPIVSWLFFLPKKNTTAHYGKASRYLKWIMIAGVFSLLIYYAKANY